MLGCLPLSQWLSLLHPAFHTRWAQMLACLDDLHWLPCACQRKGLTTQQIQAFPASARGSSPHASPRRHPWGIALWEGWSLGLAWGEGTSTLQALC